jgi:hypothetical protein
VPSGLTISIVVLLNSIYMEVVLAQLRQEDENRENPYDKWGC